MQTFVLTLKNFDISLKIQTVNKNNLLKIKKINIIKKENESKSIPKEIDLLKKNLHLCFKGKTPKLILDLLDFEGLRPIQKNVLKTLSETKAGETLSYSQLAIKSGFSKNYSRVIGSIMAKNPFPIVIACHRVIKSDGSIGNFGSGIELKAKLLSFEKKHNY